MFPPLKQTITKRPAVSLVIAMIMVLAFMMMTADIMQGMVRTQSIAKGAKFSDQAQLNAQDGIELGLYAQNKPKEFQATLKAMLANDPTLKLNGNTLTDAQGNTTSWQIRDTLGASQVCMETATNGSVTNDIKDCKIPGKPYYVYPSPGSGSVGGRDCNIKTQPILKSKAWYEDMYYLINKKKYEGTNDITTEPSLAALNTLDHPCFWNTLKNGVSAEIPLFRIDSDGNEIEAKNIDTFYVRARLPCKNGSACTGLAGSERWKLATSNNGKSIANNRALIWNIVTDCKSDALCYLSEASEKYLTDTKDDQGDSYITQYPLPQTSQITYDILFKGMKAAVSNAMLAYKNNSNKFIVGVDGTKDQNIGPIYDFLNNLNLWSNAENKKPFFHLSIAAPLYIDPNSNQTVDSIEYQILYTEKPDYVGPPLITNPTVTAQGYSGGYNVSLESSLTKQTGSFNFSLVGN